MRINTDQLSRALESSPLPQAWLVAGDEPLLVGEAADAIRTKQPTWCHRVAIVCNAPPDATPAPRAFATWFPGA